MHKKTSAPLAPWPQHHCLSKPGGGGGGCCIQGPSPAPPSHGRASIVFESWHHTPTHSTNAVSEYVPEGAKLVRPTVVVGGKNATDAPIRLPYPKGLSCLFNPL